MAKQDKKIETKPLRMPAAEQSKLLDELPAQDQKFDMNKPLEETAEVVRKPEPKLSQYELSDLDMETLNLSGHSRNGWLEVAMKHGFDPDTRKQIERTDRDGDGKIFKNIALYAVPKRYTNEEKAAFHAAKRKRR